MFSYHKLVVQTDSTKCVIEFSRARDIALNSSAHLFRCHVDTNDVSGRANELGEKEDIDTDATAEVKDIEAKQLIGGHQSATVIPNRVVYRSTLSSDKFICHHVYFWVYMESDNCL